MPQIVLDLNLASKSISGELVVMQAAGEVKVLDPWKKRWRHYALNDGVKRVEIPKYCGIPAGRCISRQYKWFTGFR
mgnify:FL=1